LLSNSLISSFLDNVRIWGSFCPICHFRLRKDFCVFTVNKTPALMKDKASGKPNNEKLCQPDNSQE